MLDQGIEGNRLIMSTEISVAEWAKSDREKKELVNKFIKDFVSLNFFMY